MSEVLAVAFDNVHAADHQPHIPSIDNLGRERRR